MFTKLFRRGPPNGPDEKPGPLVATSQSVSPGPSAVVSGADGLLGEALGAEAMARARLRSFAFTAADMLIETSGDGTIGFAAGAVRARFGVEPEELVGRSITSLFAPADQATLAVALALVALRGRIVPIVLQLGDTARSATSIAAMLVPGPPPRLCFSIGPVAILPTKSFDPSATSHGPAQFAQEVEALLRAGGNGRIGLIEVVGWKAVKQNLPATEQTRLRHGIRALMGEATAGGRASELAEGRYGVLATDNLGMDRLLGQMEKLLRNSPASRYAKVSGTEIPLSEGAMPGATASRVLRYAVSRFTSEGAAAVAALGGAGGLAGILAQAELRTQAVHETLIAHRFHLAFQPVVSLHNGVVQHYEALLRPRKTPGMRAESIQEFVTFAEAVGLSEVLDYAVLEQALLALRASPLARVAVNMSGLSLQSAAFRDRVMALLGPMRSMIGGVSEAGEPKGRLLVELTETAEVEDTATAAATIVQLRAMGVPVCLDDFGVGPAAFRYLREFKIDFVKIDGSFVRAAVTAARERALVTAMVELANSVGALTVAEMVETEGQAALMRELGVHHGQGWLFGRPGALPGALPGARW